MTKNSPAQASAVAAKTDESSTTHITASLATLTLPSTVQRQTHSTQDTKRHKMENEQVPMGPPPNFDRLREGFTVVGEEMQHMNNMPVIQGNNQILAAIAAMDNRFATAIGHINTRLDNAIEGINTRLDGIDGRLDTLSINITDLGTRQDASNHNNMAFNVNTMIRHAATPLTAFHHAVTNQDIPNFPATAGVLNDLLVTDLNAILAALNLPVHGTRPQKVERLKAKIGLISF